MVTRQEKGFNDTQKRELIEIITTVVPPMIDKAVDKAIEEKINPRLDRIEQRLDRIESCPTIKKELLI